MNHLGTPNSSSGKTQHQPAPAVPHDLNHSDLIHNDLIYDVGLFDGEDTAYYLFRGYKVVSIDANPLAIEAARVRFSREIENGQLTLLNVAISETAGSGTFWISDKHEWSSFDKAIASRDGMGHRAVPVPTVPFSQILREHGVPHYLKIDIEGKDRVCIDALRGTKLPQYISAESECVGDSEVLTDEGAIEVLQLLRNIGYTRFKLVNQGNFQAVRPGVAARVFNRTVTSLAYGKLRMKGLCGIAEKFSDLGRIQAGGFKFVPNSSSGPWGEDIPGRWMSFEEAKPAYLRIRREFFSKPRSLYSFWYDWHATY